MTGRRKNARPRKDPKPRAGSGRARKASSWFGFWLKLALAVAALLGGAGASVYYALYGGGNPEVAAQRELDMILEASPGAEVFDIGDKAGGSGGEDLEGAAEVFTEGAETSAP